MCNETFPSFSEADFLNLSMFRDEINRLKLEDESGSRAEDLKQQHPKLVQLLEIIYSENKNTDNKEEPKLEEKKEEQKTVMLDANSQLRFQGIKEISKDFTTIDLDNGDILIRPQVEGEEIFQEDEKLTLENAREIRLEDVVFNQRSLIYSLFKSFIDLLNMTDKTKADKLRKKFPGLAGAQASKDTNEVENDRAFFDDLNRIQRAFVRRNTSGVNWGPMTEPNQQSGIVSTMLEECGLMRYSVVLIDQRENWECSRIIRWQGCGSFNNELRKIGVKETFGENATLMPKDLRSEDMFSCYTGTWLNFREAVFVYRLPNNKGYVPYTWQRLGLPCLRIQRLEDKNQYIDMEINGEKAFTMQINRVNGYTPWDPVFWDHLSRNPFPENSSYVYVSPVDFTKDLPNDYSPEFIKKFFWEKCFPSWAVHETNFNYARVMVIALNASTKELFFFPESDYIKKYAYCKDVYVVAYVFRKVDWPIEVKVLEEAKANKGANKIEDFILRLALKNSRESK